MADINIKVNFDNQDIRALLVDIKVTANNAMSSADRAGTTAAAAITAANNAITAANNASATANSVQKEVDDIQVWRTSTDDVKSILAALNSMAVVSLDSADLYVTIPEYIDTLLSSGRIKLRFILLRRTNGRIRYSKLDDSESPKITIHRVKRNGWTEVGKCSGLSLQYKRKVTNNEHRLGITYNIRLANITDAGAYEAVDVDREPENIAEDMEVWNSGKRYTRFFTGEYKDGGTTPSFLLPSTTARTHKNVKLGIRAIITYDNNTLYSPILPFAIKRWYSDPDGAGYRYPQFSVGQWA